MNHSTNFGLVCATMKKTAPLATVAGSSTMTKETSIVTTFKRDTKDEIPIDGATNGPHLEDDLPLLDEVDILLGV